MAVLEHCKKATAFGNKISAHLLEFLTSENPPRGLEELSQEFLGTSRIIWAIEAALTLSVRANQQLPPVPTRELDKAFRTTQTNFQTLDQMLLRYLDYERRGTVGKIARGWHNMFENNDVGKMRDMLRQTKDGLESNASRFEWSIVGDKSDRDIDDGVGIGYLGLAAALERLEKAKAPRRLSQARYPEELVLAQKEIPIMPGGRPDSAITFGKQSNYAGSVRSNASSSASSPLTPTIPRSIDGTSLLGKSSTISIRRHAPNHANRVAATASSNYALASEVENLIKAISNKRPQSVIEGLLEAGADPNGKDAHGTTPLFAAINAARIDTVRSLLNHGADPNLPGPKHMLWPAAHHPEILQLLLERGASHNRAPGVLELSTSINCIESVRLLLKFGADPNTKKDNVWTPLCTSIRDDRKDLFDIILSSGADPNLTSAEFPCFKCITHDRLHFLQPLVDAGGNLSEPKGIMETAVKFGNTKAINWLFDAGVNPDDKVPETGAMPMITAIKEERPDLLELLVSRGADPDKAIIQALVEKDDFIIKFIVDRYKIHLNARDEQGYTISDLAKRGSQAAQDILLR